MKLNSAFVPVTILAAGLGLAACATNPDSLPLVQKSAVQRLVLVNLTSGPITLVPSSGPDIRMAVNDKLVIETTVESRNDGGTIRNFIRESPATHVLKPDVFGPNITFRDVNSNAYFLTLSTKGCPIPWETKARASEDHTVKLSEFMPGNMDVCPAI